MPERREIGLLRRGDVTGGQQRVPEQIGRRRLEVLTGIDRKSTRLNSSHPSISYAVFCLKKKISFLVLRVRFQLLCESCFRRNSFKRKHQTAAFTNVNVVSHLVCSLIYCSILPPGPLRSA